jgi:uncharacterized protein
MKEDRFLPEFQVFVKPVGPACNLDCAYCYYLDKSVLFGEGKVFHMEEDILETYIRQHIDATTGPVITFTWHGGEPLRAGLNFYRKATALQKRHNRSGRKIVNGIQTNGTLLNPEWCSFLAEEQFYVGISIDGPESLHDQFRVTQDGKPTFRKVMRGYDLLVMHGIDPEILCVVNAENVKYPLEVYRFFRRLGAPFLTFIPLVEKHQGTPVTVSTRSVPAGAFGEFLIAIFDQWIQHDIGEVKVQVFEEAIRTAFKQEHTLCIFKPVCGGVPVVEHNGDFFSCDHFVTKEHHLGNIRDFPLEEFLDSDKQKAFGQAKLNTLPRYCLECEVRDMCNGECPKNRFINTPDGEPGLNYLCAGYRKFFNHCRPFAGEVARAWKQSTE